MPKYVVEFTRQAQVEYRGSVTVTATDEDAAQEAAENLLMQGRVEFTPVPESELFLDGAVVAGWRRVRNR